MTRVFEGKQVMVEWKPIVDLLVSEFLTRSNGELMVHNPGKFIIPANSGYRVWFFTVINPWVERFNRILYAYKESAIRDVWTKQAWRYFSKKYIKQFNPKPLPKVTSEKAFHRMSLNDLGGVFITLGIFTLISIFSLAVEFLFRMENNNVGPNAKSWVLGKIHRNVIYGSNIMENNDNFTNKGIWANHTMNPIR